MTSTLFFTVFMVFICAMLALDLGVFHKKDHEIGIREAGLWTAVWVILSMALAVFIRLRGELIIDPGTADLAQFRREMCEQYLAGYFLELSLSIDNIFVMMLIFSSFGIDKRYYHRVLFWGILGAIVLRFIFIFALGALVNKFAWVLAVFGAILIVSGFKMLKGEEDESIDTEQHPMVRFCSRFFHASPKLDGHNFFTRIDGKRHITPLFIVLMVIEFSDIVFAVDSIPAIFSVTTESMIVYCSNIFAIMGLRSLFFLFNRIKDLCWLLSYGLGALLCFIGVKMILGCCIPGFHINTLVSLCVILGILIFSILFSIIIPNPKSQQKKSC